ncbi:acyltransferase family protein [Peribacillus sp. S4]|uniref:acyltransferase family protein n=1 Tax=Peribacillus sp. S4 TaxID=3384451 RepID=UPI003988DF60
MRLHYFDNGKALASILGFFYHVGLVFSIPWNINSDPEDFNDGIHLLTQILSLFRMPLFMFIAGYFAIYSVKKYSIHSFSKNKLLRLGVPLLATLYTFVFIQFLYTDVLFKGSSTFVDVVHKITPWSDTFSLAHLWFLYLVMIYSFLLYFIDKFITKNSDCFRSMKERLANLKYLSNDILFILFSFSSSLFFMVITKVSPVSHDLLPFSNFGTFLPYFIMGTLTYIFWDKYSNLFFNFTKKRVVASIIVAILAFIPTYLTQNSENLLVTVVGLVFTTIAKYYSLLLTMHILYKFLNKTNKLLRYLSDSSYSIYLLHQPVIVVISYYYLEYLDTSSYISYLCILAASIFVAYLIDFVLIRKTKIGKFLFTGVKIQRIQHSERTEERKII